mmetsp:Transcript_31016/g.45854  ORF Transcript_31016/g.45854 Transcript_31016/m.45854 type:complete len:369 (+) Transcript_31016:2-1108(+)
MRNPNLKKTNNWVLHAVVVIIIVLSLSTNISISTTKTIGIIAGGVVSYYFYYQSTKRRSIITDGEESSTLPPDQVEALIQEDEDPSIVKGSERCIVWHDNKRNTKTSTCVVFLHGWSSCRQECRPIPERLAQALQANLYCGRLPGHGGSGTKLLEEATPQQLQEEARLAWRVGKGLGDRVVLVGMSTGAALLTWLISSVIPANERDEIAKSLILISPAYALGHPAYPLMKSVFYGLRPFPRAWLLELMLGGKAKSSPALSTEHEKYTTLSYPTAALLHLLDVLEDCHAAYDPSKITMPTMFVGNPKDHVVNIPFAIELWKQFQATTKQLLCVETTEHPHCIASEILSPSAVDQISNSIISFVENTHSS